MWWHSEVADDIIYDVRGDLGFNADDALVIVVFMMTLTAG
jgi:hypothetical protein